MGIPIATAAVHAVSVVVGAVLGVALPTRAIPVAAGVAFLAFVAWTLRGDALDEDDARRAERSTGSAVVAAAVAFFLAELGDKTMLATITLATNKGALGVWAGSTLGMVMADAVAIIVGQQLGARLPQRLVKLTAIASFVFFGLLLIAEGIR